MHRSEFLKQTSVKFWLDSLDGGAPVKIFTTQYNWVGCLERFCGWIGKTPDGLIKERKDALKSDDDRIKHQAEIDVKRYLNYLEKQRHLAPSTIRNYFMGIRNFYKRNYLELTFFRGDMPVTHTVREGTRAASKDDIRNMCKVSTPRTKAMILFLKDTGLAIGDFVRLKIKDLGTKDVSQIFNLQPPIPIVINRKKTGRRTITFVGEEACEALKTTLKIRQAGTPDFRIIRHGKKEVKKGIAPEELTLQSPLFRSYHKMLTNRSEIKHLSATAVSHILTKRAKVAGAHQEGFGGHSLRRFFQTSLETSGMQQNWIKKMMGHALGGSEEPYSQPEMETLRQAYAKSYPYLAISEQAEQKSRVEALESQVEALMLNGKTKDQQIQDLEREIEKRVRERLSEEKIKIVDEILEKLNTELEKHKIRGKISASPKED